MPINAKNKKSIFKKHYFLKDCQKEITIKPAVVLFELLFADR